MALAQLMCLPVEGIGPCPNFYDSCGGASLIMSSELSIRNLDYSSSQFDLSKVEVRELSIGEDVKVHIWRIGNFELEQLPDDDLIREVVASDAIFAQLWRPLRSDYHSPDAFEVQWKELFPEVVIPYDMNERKSQLKLTYQQLSKYIDKWEELRDAGQSELRRRFFRETRFLERF